MTLGAFWAVLVAWWAILLIWAVGDALVTRDAAAVAFGSALLAVFAGGIVVGLLTWAS